MQQTDPLSTTFAALADPTRRAILARLADRRGIGQGPRRTVRHEPARDLEAPPGAGAGRAHRAGSPGPVAATTAAGGTAAGHRGLGRSVPPPLGGELRTAGRVSPRPTGTQDAAEMETTMTATRIDRGSTDDDDDLLGGRRPRLRAHLRRSARAGLEGPHGSRRVPRWWGPHGTTTTVVEMDVRPGGTWRYVSQRPRPRRRRVLRRIPRGRPARRLQVDVHVRRRGRRPEGGPETLTSRISAAGRRSRPSATWARPRPSKARSRPAWSAARSRPGTASRPCSPNAKPLPAPIAPHEGVVGASARSRWSLSSRFRLPGAGEPSVGVAYLGTRRPCDPGPN